MNKLTIPGKLLNKLVARLLHQSGLSPKDSITAAKVILFADQRGVCTHGLKNLFRVYLPQLENGTINPATNLLAIHDTQAVSMLDARGSLGLVTGCIAMREAVKKAKQFGIGLVTVKNCTHFGSAGYYTLMAAKSGCIGIALSNLGSQVVAPPPGGWTRMLGTNPISIAVPAENLPAFCLDMSTTTVCTGKLYQASAEKRGIPEGWLNNKLDGKPCREPEAYLSNTADLTFLGSSPEGGVFKGFGLALAVELLSAALSGSAAGPRKALFLPKENPAAPGNDIGQTFIAVNVRNFDSESYFEKRSSDILSSLLQCKLLNGGNTTYAGYSESIMERKTEQNGFELDPDIVKNLQIWCQKLKVSLPNDEFKAKTDFISFKENYAA